MSAKKAVATTKEQAQKKEQAREKQRAGHWRKTGVSPSTVDWMKRNGML